MWWVHGVGKQQPGNGKAAVSCLQTVALGGAHMLLAGVPWFEGSACLKVKSGDPWRTS
jgi:hypothetical protein